MPQSIINLNSYKEEIIQLYQNDSFKEDIISHLLINYNFCASVETLKQQLSIWGIIK